MGLSLGVNITSREFNCRNHMKKYLVILLLMISSTTMAEMLYETEKLRDNIQLAVSYNDSDTHKGEDKNLEYINKVYPLYTLSFFNDSSNICPNWFKGIKKTDTTTTEFCWKPSKPLIEIKYKWQFMANSNFILMPEKMIKMNFGDADFYNQPEKSQACVNMEKITEHQRRNELNFTNVDEAMCALFRKDNFYRSMALCQLPIEKKYNQFSYVYGAYVGTKIGIRVRHEPKTGLQNLPFNPKYEKYYSKNNVQDSDEVYIGNGVINKTTIFGKDKRGVGFIKSEGFNKKITVFCVLNKDREVKAIETIED